MAYVRPSVNPAETISWETTYFLCSLDEKHDSTYQYGHLKATPLGKPASPTQNLLFIHKFKSLDCLLSL